MMIWFLAYFLNANNFGFLCDGCTGGCKSTWKWERKKSFVTPIFLPSLNYPDDHGVYRVVA